MSAFEFAGRLRWHERRRMFNKARAWRLDERLMESSMIRRKFRNGDWVVYRRLKVTTHPGHRARDVDASANGDDYNYFVDKFWVVADVLADHHLLLKTSRGKTHVVAEHDLNLRHASMWERLRFRRRFIELQQAPTDSVS